MTTQTQRIQAAESAYRTLIEEIADQEPKTGWSGADIPPLSVSQMRIVLAHSGQDMLDFIDLDADALSMLLEANASPTQLGLHLVQALEKAARDSVWLDVREECTRRDDERGSEALEAEMQRTGRSADQQALFSRGLSSRLFR